MKGLLSLCAIVASILFMSYTSAEAQHDHEKCGDQVLKRALESQYPGYQEAINATFEEAKRTGRESRLTGRSSVYTVPVVFHVVWHSSDASQNIPDSVIQDQVRVLNEDYRRLNADAGDVRSEFAGVVGDAEIEFELQGIIRVSTTTLFEPEATGLDDADKVKSTADGGSDAVSPENALNIWICKLQPITLLGFPLGEVLGYAYPPAGLAHWPENAQAPTIGRDGVVLDYRTVGSNNVTASHFEDQGFTIIGRTATHEVGHYLGLRHVWGDAIALLGEDGCAVDDGVDDTPNASENNQANGCNPSTNSCESDQEDDLPDMWENYMDYSSEICQNSFTIEQIDIMRGVLEGPRDGLLNPVTCTAPVTGNITGPATVTASTTQTYSAPSTMNTFDWTVTGGVVASGAGTNSITVDWGTEGSGEVCLTESEDVCIGNQVCVSVTIEDAVTCTAPVTGSISGNFTPEMSSTETYVIPSTANTIDWIVTGGTVLSGAETNSINVIWGAESSGTVCVTESDEDCTGNQVCEDITLSVVDGIAEIAYNKGLSIYPNPATSFIKVISNEIPQSVDLINLLGATVASYNQLSTNNTLELGTISGQIIFVRVQFEDGFALQRIVVE
ncbi:MAG: hypothetical protein GY751_23340 [Bacteroidetes bacterium]|nr:hypothetical protein [Bacteroidota bacterium]